MFRPASTDSPSSYEGTGLYDGGGGRSSAAREDNRDLVSAVKLWHFCTRTGAKESLYQCEGQEEFPCFSMFSLTNERVRRGAVKLTAGCRLRCRRGSAHVVMRCQGLSRSVDQIDVVVGNARNRQGWLLFRGMGWGPAAWISQAITAALCQRHCLSGLAVDPRPAVHGLVNVGHERPEELHNGLEAWPVGGFALQRPRFGTRVNGHTRQARVRRWYEGRERSAASSALSPPSTS